MCPVCNERGIHTSRSYWKHRYCGGNIYIGNDGRYLCNLCGRNSNIMEWGYWCPTHSDSYDDEAEPASINSIVDVISSSSPMVDIAGKARLMELISNLY
jgi:hypothetical protein